MQLLFLMLAATVGFSYAMEEGEFTTRKRKRNNYEHTGEHNNDGVEIRTADGEIFHISSVPEEAQMLSGVLRVAKKGRSEDDEVHTHASREITQIFVNLLEAVAMDKKANDTSNEKEKCGGKEKEQEDELPKSIKKIESDQEKSDEDKLRLFCELSHEALYQNCDPILRQAINALCRKIKKEENPRFVAGLLSENFVTQGLVAKQIRTNLTNYFDKKMFHKDTIDFGIAENDSTMPYNYSMLNKDSLFIVFKASKAFFKQVFKVESEHKHFVYGIKNLNTNEIVWDYIPYSIDSIYNKYWCKCEISPDHKTVMVHAITVDPSANQFKKTEYIRLYEINTGKRIAEKKIISDSKRKSCVAWSVFSPDGKKFLIMGDNVFRSLIVKDNELELGLEVINLPRLTQCCEKYLAHEGRIFAHTVHSKGKYYLYMYKLMQKKQDLAQNQKKMGSFTLSNGFRHGCLSRNGNLFAYIAADKLVLLNLESNNRKEVPLQLKQGESIYDIAIFADNKGIAFSTKNININEDAFYVFDCAKNEFIFEKSFTGNIACFIRLKALQKIPVMVLNVGSFKYCLNFNNRKITDCSRYAYIDDLGDERGSAFLEWRNNKAGFAFNYTVKELVESIPLPCLLTLQAQLNRSPESLTIDELESMQNLP